MTKKKTILHVIDYMGRGGAENMLVQVLPHLKDYNNIVVAVNDKNNFDLPIECDEYFCLNMGSSKNFLKAVWRLRKFIKSRNIDLIHVHLLLSTLITRIAAPKKIPLITTIHTSVADCKDYHIWYLNFLEKFTYPMHKNFIIGVSQSVLKQYYSFLKHKEHKSYLLYTFVDTEKFNNLKQLSTNNEKCRLVSVGALRHPKNQDYIINALKKINNPNIEYHIYGSGVNEGELKALANGMQNVFFYGEVGDVNKILPEYDIYVMPSVYEGFSLSILEAMACQMPLLISNILSFNEQCENVAEYFDLNNEDDFIKKLNQLAFNHPLKLQMGIQARERVLANYTLQHHLTKLKSIYTEVFQINGQ